MGWLVMVMTRTKVPRRSSKSKHAQDPEPVAVLTACFSAITMCASVANTIINWQKLSHDRAVRVGEAEADFLAQLDSLRLTGTRLVDVIRQVGNDSDAAFKMIHGLGVEPRALTLRSGDTSLVLTRDEMAGWNALVGDAARAVTSMNAAAQAYESALSEALASGRRIEQATGVNLNSLIRNVVDHAIAFRKAQDAFQNLRASSTIDQAELRFSRLRAAATAMVKAADGFADLATRLVKVKRGR